MMSNAIDILQEIQKLMELKGENPFKVRAYEKAIQTLTGRDDLLQRAQEGTLQELPGIGKAIAEVLVEFLLHGRSSIRDHLAHDVPPGWLEMTEVPGLGPKKAMTLIKELGIQSLGELEYACHENRLLKVRGFGPKIQQKILDGIVFKIATQGKFRLSDALPIATQFLNRVKGVLQGFPNVQISETGALRRRLEVLEDLHYLIDLGKSARGQEITHRFLSEFKQSISGKIPIRLDFVTPSEFGYRLAQTTGSSDHWKTLGSPAPFEAPTEEIFYKKLALPWIPPEVRESGEEVNLAKNGFLDQLLPWDGLRGIFHNHTVRSDGKATLEEMVQEAENLGYQYIGISDHSQSAFYAQGLKEDTLLQQELEIREVQKRHPQIRIFWGIESDILGDGSLDYGPEVLERFDFVIASIHSRFKMDRQEMTERVISAVRNPFTRFLGHPTGRLLLGRKGFDLDMQAVIAEASQFGVAVEMNSHPARLDLDWRWGSEMREKKTFTSINPDAHDIEGIKNTAYGIAMARKAMIPRDQVVNAKSVKEVERWLKRAY